MKTQPENGSEQSVCDNNSVTFPRLTKEQVEALTKRFEEHVGGVPMWQRSVWDNESLVDLDVVLSAFPGWRVPEHWVEAMQETAKEVGEPSRIASWLKSHSAVSEAHATPVKICGTDAGENKQTKPR